MNFIKNPSYFQVLSCFFFAILGYQIKIIIEFTNVQTIVFFRCFIGSIIIIVYILLQKKSVDFFKSKNIFLQFLRALAGIFAMYFGYSALSFINLAQASTLSFTKVFFVSFFSLIFFKEKIKKENLFYSALGFIGIYLVIEPSQISSLNGTINSLISAIFVALGIILMSYLSRYDQSLTILFFHSIFSTALCLLFFYSYINFLETKYIANLILITLTAIIGQFFNIESYKNGKTNTIIIVSYTRVIFSFILGYVFLNEVISINILIGLFMIILATFLASSKR